jgi:Short C-terminal domain
MRGANSSRREQPDLLARPPCSISMYDESWVTVLVDQAAQLEMLADLLGRGLLTQEEFERQKSKVLEPGKYRSQP